MKPKAEVKIFGFSFGLKELVAIAFILAVLVRLVYNVNTGPYSRQHDFADNNGHYDYIKLIATEHRLPDSYSWQYYHPPLSHFLLAVGYSAAAPLMTDSEGNVDDAGMADFLQIFPLTYSIILLWLFYLILREIIESELFLFAGFCLFAFHPSNIILSASLNNDMLTYLFYAAAMLYTIRWYREPSYKNIIILGLMIACATLSKFSGVTIAPITAAVFLYVLIKRKDIRKKLIGQFCVFALVCIPLALSYTIRNFILFGQPLGYVADLGKDNWQYVPDNAFMRLFGFYPEEWASPYIDARRSNIPVAAFKQSLFGEYGSVFAKWNSAFGSDKLTLLSACAVSLSALVLTVFGAIVSFKYLVSKQQDNIIKFIIFGNFILQLGLYIYFNIRYPYGCTTDFRYLLPLLLSGGMLFAQGLKFTENRNIRFWTGLTIAAFSVSSLWFYIVAS